MRNSFAIATDISIAAINFVGCYISCSCAVLYGTERKVPQVGRFGGRLKEVVVKFAILRKCTAVPFLCLQPQG
jgi:hypothetical protein